MLNILESFIYIMGFFLFFCFSVFFIIILRSYTMCGTLRFLVFCLQVAAGGKLFNIVVDTENTGKQLLQNGELRRRVTIIPLNKIQGHSVSSRVQNAAVRLVSLWNGSRIS